MKKSKSIMEHMKSRNSMQQPKPKKVNSDSLMEESTRKKLFAREQERIAKGQIKANGGNTPMRVPYGPIGNTGPTGNERMAIVKKYRKSATQDSIAATKGYPKSKKK